MIKLTGARRSPNRIACRRPRRPAGLAEALEGRVLLSTYTVTSTADVAPTDASYVGTLRWAVAQANAADAPASSPSVIGFSPSFFVPVRKTITLTQGQLELTQGATKLAGPSAAYLTVSGNNAVTVLVVDVGATAAVSGLTISGGQSVVGVANDSGNGGGVSNEGTLTLTDCNVSGNAATRGGGVYNGGTLILSRCTVSNDSTYAYSDIFTFIPSLGGGVYNDRGMATLSGCTLSADQSHNGDGGGAYNNGGTLAITASTLSNDAAPDGSGGGVSNPAGTLALNDCTLSGDTAPTGGDGGGGIDNGGTAAVSGCTFTADSAAFGGAADNVGTLSLKNCTLVGNSASGALASGAGFPTGVPGGGGVANAGALSLDDCTVWGNSAPVGGGLLTYSPSPVALNNTIAAGDTSTAATSTPALAGDLFATPGTGGTAAASFTGSNNLIGDGTNATGLSNGSRGNQAGTTAAPLDPKLAPLADNGGPTQTMAPLAGSPALDAGSAAVLPPGTTTDQRGPGFARAYGPTVDIGAVELQPAAPAPIVTAVTLRDPAGNGGAAGSTGGQRSIVSQLVVTFSEAVRLSAGAFTLGLVNNYGSGANDGSADTNASSVLGVPSNPSGDGVTWVIPVVQSGTDTTFSYLLTGGGGASLQDGVYHLNVTASAVTASNGGAAMASAYTSPLFHRLFGDTDGNKTANALDYARFKSAFGSSVGGAAYNADLDTDGNGTVNALDYAQFKKRFGMTFSYP